MPNTVVIGAGPAGLTTAYTLSKHGHEVTVLEASDTVGGLFRTEQYRGCCVDFGAGGFSTCVESARQIWDELAGEDVTETEVRSLIHFHNRLFKYPLSVTNAIKHLGPIDTALTGISYLKNWLAAQQTPLVEEHTAKEWVNRRFGNHLNRIFFEPYFEKVWGIPGQQLAPDMAKRSLIRPSGEDHSLIRATTDAVINASPQTVTYPKLGAGQPWVKCKERIEQAGGAIAHSTQIIKLVHADNRVTQAIVIAGDNIQTIPVEQLVSSLPLAELVTHLDAPYTVQESAQRLKHRHLIQVALVLDVAKLFCEQLIHINSADVAVGRIQNFKSWSAAMVPSPHKTCLGLTYFCDESDALWHKNEAYLVRLASQELLDLGLIESLDLIDSGTVIRQPHAYPIHTAETLQHRAIVQNYLEGFENLQTVGRSGLHTCAPLDYCMLSGVQAAENILKDQTSLSQISPGQTSLSPHANRNLWDDTPSVSQSPAQDAIF